MPRSRRRLNARRRLASVACLPSVIIGSTTPGSSLAFGKGRLMAPWFSTQTVMLRGIARRSPPVRVDLRGLLFLDRGSRAFERRENRKLIDQNPRCVTDRLLGLDHAVRLDVNDELVEVGALLDARRFDRIGHTSHGRERGIQYDLSDALGFLGDDTEIPGDVPTAVLDLDLHLDLASGGKRRDHMLRIDDFDIVSDLDVGRGHGALTFFLQAEQRVLAVVKLEHYALEV